MILFFADAVILGFLAQHTISEWRRRYDRP